MFCLHQRIDPTVRPLGGSAISGQRSLVTVIDGDLEGVNE